MHHAPFWKRLLARARGCANALRRRFDHAPFSATPAAIVITIGALTIAAAQLIQYATLRGCPDLAVDPLRLQATFDARQFAALVASEGLNCSRVIPWVFFADILFSLIYPFALAALFMWVERWRRYHVDGSRTVRPPLRPRHHLLVLAPLVAGALDIIPEDILLGIASINATSPLNGIFVWLGSLGAVLKWIVLAVFAWGVCAELLAGPRGLIVRMLRFSVLGAVLGSLPLLLIPQGQDILQRLVEGDHYIVAAGFGIAAIVFVAFAVWYSGRALVQLRIADLKADGSSITQVDDWYEHFAEYTPRALGTAVVLVSAAALAKVGIATIPLSIALFLGIIVIATEGALRALVHRLRGTLVKEDAPDDLSAAARRRRTSAIIASVLSATIMFGWAYLKQTEDGLRRLTIASGLCLVAAWLFYLWVQFRHVLGRNAVSKTQRTRLALNDDAEHLQHVARYAWAAVLVSGLAFLAFTAQPVRIGRVIGPLWVLAIAAANAVLIGSLVVRLVTRFKFPLVRVMLVLALLFSVWNDNHLVRTTVADAADAREAHADSLVVAGRVTLDSQYARWRRTAGASGAANVILVASAGGGLRAAYWTAAALAAIQDAHPAFSRRVFALSTVSGGSLGGALFAGLVHDGDTLLTGIPCAPLAESRTKSDSAAGPYTRCVRTIMRDDFLSPVLSKMVAPDFFQRFLPITFKSFDRSTALEESWEASYRNATDKPTFRRGIAALGADSLGASRPTLFLNSTHVESGRRYVASSVKFDGRLGDAGDMLRAAGADLPLSVAVHNSARFTFVSPAGRLSATDTLGRVVDGGYFENSGLATLQEIANVIRRIDASRRVVVLYLCNDPLSCANDLKVHPDSIMPRNRSTWANELLAPVRAVLHARDARGALARAQITTDTSLRFFQLNVCDRLVDITRASADSAKLLERGRERVVSPPLGWLLSRIAREWMDASLDPVKKLGEAECRVHNLGVLDTLGMLVSAP